MLFVSRNFGKFLVRLVVAGLLTLPVNAALISDSGFETATQGTYTSDIGDGWNVLSGTINIATNFSGYGLAHGGVQYVDLDYDITINSLSQTLATVIGQAYTVSFWLGDDVGGNPVTVTFGDAMLLNTNTPAGLGFYSNQFNYSLFSYNVVADSSSTDLTFSSSYTFPGEGIGAVIDDVSVDASAVPEPATLCSLVAGLLLLTITGTRLKMQESKISHHRDYGS